MFPLPPALICLEVTLLGRPLSPGRGHRAPPPQPLHWRSLCRPMAVSPCVRTHREGPPLGAFLEKEASRRLGADSIWGRDREKMYPGAPVLLSPPQKWAPSPGAQKPLPPAPQCLRHSTSSPPGVSSHAQTCCRESLRRTEVCSRGWDKPRKGRSHTQDALTRPLTAGPSSSFPKPPACIPCK